MANEVKMPQLGLTMTEGTVGAWQKKVGDKISVGELLVEIQTDKLTSELNSEFEGEILYIAANEGDDVPVQGLLCVIGAPGEKYEGAAAAPAAAQAAEAPVAAAPQAAAPAQTVSRASGERIRISPLAKKTAQAKGVDYSNIAGSGPGGRIIQSDILAAPAASAAASAAAQAAPVAEGRREKLSGMRKVVAERMLKSHTEVPVVTQNMKIDMTALMEFRKQLNENREKRFSVNDFILKAVAKALADNKQILCSLDGNEIVYHDNVNLGMAVALDSGLIVPVIRDADKMSLSAISETAKDLASRARSGELQMDEYKGSTFSISNLGMFDVESFTPIINQPESGILGVGATQDELALVEGQVVTRKVARICLTYDHRLMDGAVAAKFQKAIKELLENPMNILL